MNERKIQEIVEKVLEKVTADPAVKAVVQSSTSSGSSRASRTPGIHVPEQAPKAEMGYSPMWIVQ